MRVLVAEHATSRISTARLAAGVMGDAGWAGRVPVSTQAVRVRSTGAMSASRRRRAIVSVLLSSGARCAPSYFRFITYSETICQFHFRIGSRAYKTIQICPISGIFVKLVFYRKYHTSCCEKYKGKKSNKDIPPASNTERYANTGYECHRR